MKSVLYEGTIGVFNFKMVSPTTIEVWGDDSDFPESYINLKEGVIKSKKDFDTEISYWYMRNVG